MFTTKLVVFHAAILIRQVIYHETKTTITAVQKCGIAKNNFVPSTTDEIYISVAEYLKIDKGKC